MTLKEHLIQALLDEGIIQSPLPLPTNQGYHCCQCSCSSCRNAREDCVCETNDILRVIEEVFASDSEEGA